MKRPLFASLLLAVLPGAGGLEAQSIEREVYSIPPSFVLTRDQGAIQYTAPWISSRPGRDSPTALDHRFPAAGLAASAGFVCDNDGHIPVLHGVAAGAEPGRLLGTTLRLPF